MVKSIVYGFICYIVTQGLTLLIVFIVGLFNKDIMNLYITNNIVNIDVVKLIMFIGIIIYTIYLYIYYKVDLILFNKGIDVE